MDLYDGPLIPGSKIIGLNNLSILAKHVSITELSDLTADAGTLTSGTYQTSASGKMIKLDETTDSLLFYDGTEADPVVEINTNLGSASNLPGIELGDSSLANCVFYLLNSSGATTEIKPGSITLSNAGIVTSEIIKAVDVTGILLKDSADATQGTIDTNGLTLSAGASVNEFSIDDTLAGDSDDAVPTEQAVKAYIDAHIGSGGASHADVVAAGADGFMTGADKTKLNTVDSNADVTGDNAPQAHSAASHNDINATGTEINTVADGGTAKNSHAHTHASTTGKTANDHHNETHTHDTGDITDFPAYGVGEIGKVLTINLAEEMEWI